jgi:hypothetical protein
MRRVGPSPKLRLRPNWMLIIRVSLLAVLLGGCRDESSTQTRSIQPSTVPEKAETRCPLLTRVVRDLTLTKACSPYTLGVGGMDVIQGATLTIEAGVELRFRGDDWLEVGAAGSPGRLIARGTAEAPIVFGLGNKTASAGWLGVWFASGTLEGSVLSHAIVRDAGGLNPMHKPPLPLGGITLTGVKPGVLTLGDVRLEKCRQGGLRMTESHVQLGALSFSDMEEGINVDAPGLGQITEPAQFSAVSRNVVRGGRVEKDSVWVAQALPFVVEGDIQVGGPSEPKLTLGAGLELRFAKSRGLVVGADQPGGLVAEGTRERPIKLTASDPGQTWSGLRLMRHTARGTRLSFVDVGRTEGEAAIAVYSEPGRVEIRDGNFSANARDVFVGCGSKPVLGKNEYGSSSGLARQESCK